MNDQPISVEHYRWHTKLPDETFDTIEEAARAAAMACNYNTSWYGEARNVDTGETWDRDTLLDLGEDTK